MGPLRYGNTHLCESLPPATLTQKPETHTPTQTLSFSLSVHGLLYKPCPDAQSQRIPAGKHFHTHLFAYLSYDQ